MNLRALLAGLTALALLPGAARADTFSYSGSMTDVTTQLGNVGLAPADQNFLTYYTVPGPAGTPTTLHFTYLFQDGGYSFAFGLVLPDNTQKLLFDEKTSSPGDTKSLDFLAGTVLGFYLVPDTGSALATLYSDDSKNPGNYDQLLTFTKGNLTLLAWEDVTRNISDKDFNDAIFTMRAEPTIPEPTTALLLGAALAAAGAARRRSARRAC